MSRFTRRVRIAFLKTMEALGTSAANLAGSAKLKVQELTLENRRREILTDFSLQAFELWQKGAQLPEPLATMLAELCEVESRLSVLRAQKFAKLNAEHAPVDGDAQAAADGALPAATDGDAASAALDAETAADGIPRPENDGTSTAGETPTE